MLVLSRKTGEEIVIGDDIHITVVAVQGERVRIGVSAPSPHDGAARAVLKQGPFKP